MNHTNNNVSVVVRSSVNIIKTASIRKAVMVEERGIRVDTVSSDRTLARIMQGTRLHKAKGIELVLGKQSSCEF